MTGLSGATWCDLPPNAPAWHHALVSAGGNGFNSLAALVLLALERFRLRSPRARLVLLGAGATCLVSAAHSIVVFTFDPTGDSYRVIEALALPNALRYVLVVLGGAILLAGSLHAFRRLVSIASAFEPLETFKERLALLLVVAGLPLATVILAFDLFPVAGVLAWLLAFALLALLLSLLAVAAWKPLPAPPATRDPLTGSFVTALVLVALAVGLAFHRLAAGLHWN